MRIIYFDCSMGAAGDMLTAALTEIHPDISGFLKRINNCGIPGTYLNPEKSIKCGIIGTHMNVLLDGEVEHESKDKDIHHHDHMSVSEIEHIIFDLSVPNEVKADISGVFNILAQAESKVHGMPIEQIHLHEVGTMDALADITAVCMLLYELKPDKIIASAVNVGGGTVKCAHGILPVPAPATAEILTGIPTYCGTVKSELCTPTGAALLKYFVDEFSDMPLLAVSKIGYGMGHKEFDIPNCVRAFLGEAETEYSDSVSVISCNIDDMTGEDLGFAMSCLLDSGALDVWTAPIYMKKNRPAYMMSCMCKTEDTGKFTELIFRHTTTLGVRISKCDRRCMERKIYTKKTPFGDVRIKQCSRNGKTEEKEEYDDIARIAKNNGMTLAEIRKNIE